MPKLTDKIGSGMTERGVVHYDLSEPGDVRALIQAAGETLDRSSFGRLVQRLTRLTTQILAAADLPSDPEMMYRVTAERSCEPAGPMTPDAELDADRLPLQMAVLTCGYAPDSPEGYAARVIVLLRRAKEQLQAGSMDEAMATAFDAGALVNEAGMKETFEPDVLVGGRVREGGQEGHKKVHGSEEEKASRRRSYLEAFDLLRAKKVDKMKAYRAVAKRFGVSLSTVQRAIKEGKDQA